MEESHKDRNEIWFFMAYSISVISVICGFLLFLLVAAMLNVTSEKMLWLISRILLNLLIALMFPFNVSLMRIRIRLNNFPDSNPL